LPHDPRVEGSSLGIAVVDTGGLYYKPFYGRNLQIFRISYSVCPWEDFPAKSMFVSKANPRAEHQKGASLGEAPALLANIDKTTNFDFLSEYWNKLALVIVPRWLSGRTLNS
jgi:hypothetical protein